MPEIKIEKEHIKEFWKHNIHPITGYRAIVFRVTPYVKKSERKNNQLN